MSLVARLEAAKPNPKPKFELWVENLPAIERESLIAAAKDPAWRNVALLAVLKDEGAPVSKELFAKWRNNVAS